MGVQADIFSLGVILFILAFGSPPFNEATMKEQNYRILQRSPEKFWINHPNVKNSRRGGDLLNKDLSDLITSLMMSSPSDRPQTIKEIVSHPFFTNDKQLLDPMTN